uniref:Uncharacterized protein n=1 Tax=Cacopsylla melanoneura TaxID=428564 RepID=A0A8D9EA89_9HEMI
METPLPTLCSVPVGTLSTLSFSFSSSLPSLHSLLFSIPLFLLLSFTFPNSLLPCSGHLSLIPLFLPVFAFSFHESFEIKFNLTPEPEALQGRRVRVLTTFSLII